MSPPGRFAAGPGRLLDAMVARFDVSGRFTRVTSRIDDNGS